MTVSQIHYEELLAVCSGYQGALALLKNHRPYLELLPSMRRPDQSLVTIPLPNISVRQSHPEATGPVRNTRTVVSVPCDVTVLMCDPEWKIKTGVEIFIFIHRPEEEFSELLCRWRQTQRLLSGGYEWLMPRQQQHLLAEGADTPYPLFVTFPQTPRRIWQGLKGAGLPVIVHTPVAGNDLDSKTSPLLEGATSQPGIDTLTKDASGLADWELNGETQDDMLDGLD
jgi:hypothetical protein